MRVRVFLNENDIKVMEKNRDKPSLIHLYEIIYDFDDTDHKITPGDVLVPQHIMEQLMECDKEYYGTGALLLWLDKGPSFEPIEGSFIEAPLEGINMELLENRDYEYIHHA